MNPPMNSLVPGTLYRLMSSSHQPLQVVDDTLKATKHLLRPREVVMFLGYRMHYVTRLHMLLASDGKVLLLSYGTLDVTNFYEKVE